LPLSFEASARCRAPRGEPDAEAPDTGTLPLLGFATLSPLHRSHPTRVHSRGQAALAPDTGGSEEPWGRRHHPPGLSFRPRGFAPPRRVPPREGPRACCIPLPVLGFAAFPGTRSLGPDISTARALTGCRGETGSFPATLRPFEEFPPFPAVRCHHRLIGLLAVEAPPGGHAPRSPLPVGGSGAVRRSPSTSRRCSENGSVALDTLAGAESLVPSMGLMSPSWPDFLRASRDSPWATRPRPEGRCRAASPGAVAKHRVRAEDIPLRGPPKRPRGSVRRGRSPGSFMTARKRAVGRPGRPPWGSRR
jgi:hypothetical protein